MNTSLQHEILAVEAVDTFHRAYKAEDDPYKHIYSDGVDPVS